MAIPLRILAEYWVAHYWPFIQPHVPISQGPHSLRQGGLTNDMAFRPALAALLPAWEAVIGGAGRASDGFFLINEFRVVRRRDGYPPGLRTAFAEAVRAVSRAIEQPIRYAGPGEWGVFPRPLAFAALPGHAVGVPRHEKRRPLRSDWAGPVGRLPRPVALGRDKLVEEAREAATASDAELAAELADLQEVIDTLIDACGLSHDAVRALQQQRRADRGGFASRLRLLWTE